MTRSPVILDSGITIHKVLDTPAHATAAALWDRLLLEEAVLYAPRLWSCETTSTLRKYVHTGILSTVEAEDALDVISDLGVTLVDEDRALCLAALHWAARLKQRVAYDAFYLALAEKLNADFWTTDKRLWNNARGLGVTWIHLLAEA